MKLVAALLLICASLPADTMGPINRTTDGISYSWYWSPTNYDIKIWTMFSEPVTGYTMDLYGPSYGSTVRVGKDLATPDYGRPGHWTVDTSNLSPITQLVIDVNASYFTPDLTFTKLIDPPSPTRARVADVESAPEPFSIVLTVLGLLVLIPAQRWRSR